MHAGVVNRPKYSGNGWQRIYKKDNRTIIGGKLSESIVCENLKVKLYTTFFCVYPVLSDVS